MVVQNKLCNNLLKKEGTAQAGPSVREQRAAKPVCLNLLDSNRKKNIEQMLDLKSANSVKRLLMIKMCTRWCMLKKVKAANVTGGQIEGPRC